MASPDHPRPGVPGLTPDGLRGERLPVNLPACPFRLAGDRLLGPVIERVSAGRGQCPG